MALPFLAAGVFGGLLFGAAAGAIASALRTGFITPMEVERLLGLPTLAEFADGRAPFQTVAAETAIGGLATLLLDSELDGRPLRAFHFLSQERHPDVPVFCQRLAEEFAIQRGLRTLLIDLSSPPARTAPMTAWKPRRPHHRAHACAAADGLWPTASALRSSACACPWSRGSG